MKHAKVETVEVKRPGYKCDKCGAWMECEEDDLERRANEQAQHIFVDGHDYSFRVREYDYHGFQLMLSPQWGQRSSVVRSSWHVCTDCAGDIRKCIVSILGTPDE